MSNQTKTMCKACHKFPVAIWPDELCRCCASEAANEVLGISVGESGAEYDHRVDHWLTEKVREGKGAVIISETEGGDIGIFIGTSEKSLGIGDTVFDAISSIMRREEAK